MLHSLWFIFQYFTTITPWGTEIQQGSYTTFSMHLLEENLAFFQEFFQGVKPIVMQISFVLLFFLLFLDQISGGSIRGGKLPWGCPLSPCGGKPEIADEIFLYISCSVCPISIFVLCQIQVILSIDCLILDPLIFTVRSGHCPSLYSVVNIMHLGKYHFLPRG